MLFSKAVKARRGQTHKNYLMMVMLLFLSVILSPYAFSQPAENQNLNSSRVLIIFGPHYGIPTADILLPAITETLKKGGIQSDHIYVEFLDFFRFPDIGNGFQMSELLTQKYSETPIDLIIPISQVAVDFVAGELSSLSPGAPFLIPGFEAEPEWESGKRPLITLPTELDIEGTLSLAIKLFPSAERLVVVSGDDEYSRLFLNSITATAEKFPEFRAILHTADMDYSEMLQFIEELPNDTIAIFGTYFIDSAGQSYVPAEVAKRTAEQSAVPVFGIRDIHVENGLVGGSVIMNTKLGEQAAEAALEFLSGELELNGTDINLKAQHFPLFNWQQLKRFGAETKKLPETTIFFNRPQTMWENHKIEIIFAVVIFVMLILFIVFLNIKNANLRLALEAQKKAEKKLNMVLKDKEKLIQELSHRSYNNMQVIQALLEYKLSAHPDISLKQFVNDINGQIRSMAFAYRELQRGDHLSRIDLGEYIKTLVQFIVGRSKEDVKIEITFDLVPVQILIDSARPLGIIINELVTNVIKHAFPGNLKGDINAELRVSSRVSESNEIDLRISDNGIVWAPSDDQTTLLTGGIGLVIALVKEQLGGTIFFDETNGTTCVISFKDNLYTERV